jgi:hypothetical protein
VAKNSDHRAGIHDADLSGGGKLFGLFAEENEYDRRAMLRVGMWGFAAVGAVVLAVMANQSQLGWRREQVAAVDLARQAQQIQVLTKESQNETRRLASAIDTLNSDRDRLFSRVTVLEQGLDSVTGAIRKVAASELPKPPPSVAPPPASTMSPSIAAFESALPAQPNPVQSAAPGQTGAPVAATAAPGPEKPRDVAKSDAAKPDPSKSDSKPDPAPTNANSLPQIAAIKPAVPLPGAILPPSPAGTSPAPPVSPTKSMMGPPDPAAPKLVESAAKPLEPAKPVEPTKEQAANTGPASISAAPLPPPAAAPVQDIAAADTKDKATGPKDQDKPATDGDEASNNIRRTEFAVELGGANSIGGLRALWRGLLKSNNAELAELRPIIILRESLSGLGMQLRLAAGPLNDAAEAAKICASLVESKRSCETTVFDGQRLAMGADDPTPGSAAGSASSSKPARQQSYRRYTPKRAKKEDPAPPPKQESSTFSSLFGAGKK